MTDRDWQSAKHERPEWADDETRKPGDYIIQNHKSGRRTIWEWTGQHWTMMPGHLRRSLRGTGFLLLGPVAQHSEHHKGYIYFQPDTGTEWSEDHPIEANGSEGVEDVKPATLDVLHAELISAWNALEESERLRNQPGELPEDVLKGLRTIKKDIDGIIDWAGASDFDRIEETASNLLTKYGGENE